MIDRDQLAEFLRRRREALQPEDVGMPRGQRRRTGGLRREEVAVLCHMSTDYYSRLEQRRGPQPSEQMVASIAQGLHLTIAERDHLASKPAPDVFLEGARMLGVDPARSVAIEDAISGVESAAAGKFALVIGVDRGTGPDELRAAGAHLVVDDLAELVAATGSDSEESPA